MVLLRKCALQLGPAARGLRETATTINTCQNDTKLELQVLNSPELFIRLCVKQKETEAGRRFSSSLPSSTHSVEDEVDTRENETVAPDFTNRNPHNLEQMVVARKERGWKTTWPKREYWHRLRLERTQRHVEAYVEHSSGCVVVSASTREWAIKKHLRNTAGVAACENVGRVLAQRCLEGGINFVDFRAVIPWEKHCDSIQKFQNAMTEGGVVLKELRRIYE